MSRDKSLINRRQFLISMGAIGAAAGFSLEYSSLYGNIAPSKVFVDLHNFSNDPIDVAKHFQSANTPTLNVIYSKFFPPFLDRWNQDALSKIMLAVMGLKKDPKRLFNQHRLDALPAIVACHLLPRTLHEEKERLFSEISEALQDDRREVKEMVLQNLYNASLPDFDSYKYFSINTEILNAIDQIIKDSEDTPLLVTPLCLCTEILLNIRLLLSGQGGSNNYSEINKRIEQIEQSKSENYKYINELIKSHSFVFRGIVKKDIIKCNLLPPQHTEALLGWELLPKKFIPYLNSLAIITAHRVYNTWKVASGKTSQMSLVMNKEDAIQALPKGLALIKYHNLKPLLPSDSSLKKNNLIGNDTDFKNFLRIELNELLNHPYKYSLDLNACKPNEKEHMLSQCVPFSQFDSKKMLPIILSGNRRNIFLDLIKLGVSSIGGSGAFAGFYELVIKAFHLESAPKVLCLNEKEKILEKVNDKVIDIEKNCSDSADEQEKQIGDIKIHMAI